MQIVSYDNTGCLTIQTVTGTYTYYHVSPHVRNLVRVLIRKKAYGKVFLILKRFRRPELHMETVK